MGNCAGFTANRVFFPYSVAAAFLVAEHGLNPYLLDDEVKKSCLPVSPFALMDLIGVDVNAHVATVRDAAFAPRLFTAPRVAAIQNQIIRDRDLGRVTGRGWYI